MPALSNIQTYEKIKGADYKPTLKKFESVLKSIGLWNHVIEKAFADFSWNIQDDGFIYSAIVELGFFKTKYSAIEVRPLLMVYPATIDSSFTDTWINCELLIETEHLGTEKYFNKSYELIESLALELQKKFKHTGIYFTDEAQDGQDFEAIASNNRLKLWQFDYALIPLTLKDIYSELPSTHIINERTDFLEVYHKERWLKNSHSQNQNDC